MTNKLRQIIEDKKNTLISTKKKSSLDKLEKNKRFKFFY